MRRADLRYRLVGGIRFFDRAEIKDLVAYLRLLITPSSDVDVLRIINRPTRGIGAKTVERLQARAAAESSAARAANVSPRLASSPASRSHVRLRSSNPVWIDRRRADTASSKWPSAERA